ncbi:MAG: MoaD family protein [Nitrososphaerota archaeon]|jgi:MoaD family protein|nr:MoaD family protein [Nitrososphaerota archaeon]
MPLVKVRVFFELFNKMQQDELYINARNPKGLIDNIIRKYGDDMKSTFFNGDSLRRYFLIYVNGKPINYTQNYLMPLKEGDVVLLIPPVGGG